MITSSYIRERQSIVIFLPQLQPQIGFYTMSREFWFDNTNLLTLPRHDLYSKTFISRDHVTLYFGLLIAISAFYNYSTVFHNGLIAVVLYVPI